MGYYNSKNYKARHYKPASYRKGNQSYRYSGGNRHREHLLRNSMYGALTCIISLCFALMWWGIATASVTAIVIGAIAVVFAAITSITVHIKNLAKYKRFKESYYA